MKVLTKNHRDLSIMVGMMRDKKGIMIVESETLKYDIGRNFELTTEELARVVPISQYIDNKKQFKDFKVILFHAAATALQCLTNDGQEIMAVAM